MIAAVGQRGELCSSCGDSLYDQHVCYWNRARVCIPCFEDLAEGEDRLDRALAESEAYAAGNRLPDVVWGAGMLTCAVFGAFALLLLLFH